MNTAVRRSGGQLSSEAILSKLDSLRDEVLAHPILQHPFLNVLRAGKVTPQGIRLWITQQFYFSTQFPRCLAALFARIEDYEASRLLIPLLNVEHWGSPSESSHWRQFVKVLRFFSLDPTKLKGEQAFPETREYLAYRLRICTEASVEEGLGTLGFAHEPVNEGIFAAYLAGMENIPAVTEEALSYFKAHVADEPGDYLLFREITLKIAQTSQALSRVRKGALATLAARSRFFDRMLKRVAANGGFVPKAGTEAGRGHGA
ncbi:MAG: iron-containing redox enzyme family protein [Acidobacteria bacterium]|nr:iron-containing redox enzyme family protein [Acidobacteriota bacterium]MCI0620139.1 iron-containing redox enzyme family protein [Acidobacteriota bacterium]MCI0720567.1 iron-containing redox enzyme family protein [Acidobacteriota bacterium]